MFGFGKKPAGSVSAALSGPAVSTRLCTDRFAGDYPHVGLYDCSAAKVWVAKPLNGQAIRTSHAKLITGGGDAVGTAWKDRFLCFWFYTPNTGSGCVLGYPIDWTEAQLLVRIDPQWDYDRQTLIPPDLTQQVDDNLERQSRHGDRVFDFFVRANLEYPFSLHLVGQRAQDSRFYVRRTESRG